MTAATQRAILRWLHLVATIPVLGYVYGDPKDVVEYVDGPRNVFVPLLILTGYWMYAGAIFAFLSVAAWMAAFHLGGFGPALLSQVVLLLGRKVWLMTRGRKSTTSA